MYQYQPNNERYSEMTYRRCGQSGLRLPRISLGLWHNFGSVDVYQNCVDMATAAFDLGITHFDLANNYGPQPGSAEVTMGRILATEFRNYRDELVISSKAGYTMWEGPYGDFGSRKYLIASCDQSLRRLGLEYVDIFYHHRPDPETPLEESLGAVAQIVRSGKALYAGISNYNAVQSVQAIEYFRQEKIPFVLNQVRYNLFDRKYENDGLFDLLQSKGIGSIIFSPLAQGLLTDKYLDGIPPTSRAARNHFLKSESITPELVAKIKSLNTLAKARGQSLASMAVAWVLRQKSVTSALIGASRPAQIADIVKNSANADFSDEEIQKINGIAPV